jgi:hypothetical protein
MRIVVSLVVLILLALPMLAAAQTDEPPEGAMLIILDASGSMNSLDQDGIPFIDKAKDAVLELIAALPDGMQVGLRAYGHREPNTDPVRGCLDTELLAPVAPLDRAAIGAAIEGLEASGYTPIGLSLQEAAADLPETGPRSIVLISDGEDTCTPPDPCQIAEELFGDLFDVRIESVGFLVGTGSAAEQQLRCIAEITGGEYTTVDNANALVARLSEVTEAILDWRPLITLNGALNPLEAPEFPLAAKADWVTDEPGKIAVGRYGSILMPGETRWYGIDLWTDEAVWIWSELEWPQTLAVAGHLETIILDSDGNRVEAAVGHGQIPLRTELSGTGFATVAATVQEQQEGWVPAASYLVGLHWDAPSEVFLGSLLVSVEVINADAPRYAGRTVIEGALEPADAPVLPLAGSPQNDPDWRGGVFRAPLASGETRWYRLDMERGETMNTFALFPGNRFVGAGTEGEFAIVLTDLDGNPVGRAHEERPQLSQTFGVDQHPVMVSGTTSSDPDPAPETVMVGFRWDGPPGQESEILFEAEAMFDPFRKEMADRLEAEASSEVAQPGEPTDEPTAATTTTMLTAADEESDGGGFPGALLVALGALVVGGTALLLLIRRSRAG